MKSALHCREPCFKHLLFDVPQFPGTNCVTSHPRSHSLRISGDRTTKRSPPMLVLLMALRVKEKLHVVTKFMLKCVKFLPERFRIIGRSHRLSVHGRSSLSTRFKTGQVRC